MVKKIKKKNQEEESGGPARGEGGVTLAGRGWSWNLSLPPGLVAPVFWGQHEVAPSAVTGGQVAAAAFQNVLGGDPQASRGPVWLHRPGRGGGEQSDPGWGLCGSGGHSVDIKDPAQFFGHQSFCRVRVTSAKIRWGGRRASPQGDGLV